MQLDHVTLRVRDLDAALSFYNDVIGLETIEADGATAGLGAGGRSFLRLEERKDAKPRGRAAGLYHIAILLEDRGHLGAALLQLARRGVRLTGAADHHVSEAVYLDDPEGNGLELYADRPRAHWHEGGRLVMVNQRLDLDGLVAAAEAAGVAPAASAEGAVLGHIHLEVRDPALSAAFAVRELGMEEQVAWPHARFLSWNGYHHHLAVNDWNARSEPAGDPDRLGLVEVGIGGDEMAGERVDPDGIVFRLRAGG